MTLFIAMLLDAVLGEPAWLWSRFQHPAVLMGRAVAKLDDTLNVGKDRIFKGTMALAMLVVGAALFGWLLSLFGPLVEIIVVAILLAQRSLVSHTKAVADGLRMSLAQGRRAVALIVSRDTKNLDAPAVARSAIESASENLSDGVIAPAFWFIVAGLPGLLVYKVVNTADSMIGYRTPRHQDFGKAAARFDDLLNWIPARLTAAMIALPTGRLGQWREIAADARLHKSPNAGWPEAAMSRAIGVALAGPRPYDGEMKDFAWVNPTGKRSADATDIDAAIRVMWQAWAVLLGLVLISALL